MAVLPHNADTATMQHSDNTAIQQPTMT